HRDQRRNPDLHRDVVLGDAGAVAVDRALHARQIGQHSCDLRRGHPDLHTPYPNRPRRADPRIGAVASDTPSGGDRAPAPASTCRNAGQGGGRAVWRDREVPMSYRSYREGGTALAVGVALAAGGGGAPERVGAGRTPQPSVTAPSEDAAVPSEDTAGPATPGGEPAVRVDRPRTLVEGL